MAPQIDTLLLLALPASGKSELRRYLASVDADTAARDFGLGPTVQLDDYPYVHLMRRVSEELRNLGEPPVFFASDSSPFIDGRDWATLTALVTEDYAALGTRRPVPDRPTEWILDRFDRARAGVGAARPFTAMADTVRNSLSEALDDEAATFAAELADTLASHVPGVSTVLIEFARGGPEGATPPLPEPHGYAYSLPHLSPDLLERASALYVWVTPQESRRRNEDRATPGPEGDASILHHGVPEIVMRGDYGVDDFLWLIDQGGGHHLDIAAHGTTFALPAAVFDNRQDHTSFLRADPSQWDPGAVEALHSQLVEAFKELRTP